MPRKPRKEVDWLEDKKKLGKVSRRVIYPEFAHIHPRLHQMIFGGPGTLEFPSALDWATFKPLFRSEREWAAHWIHDAAHPEEGDRAMAESLSNPEIRKELQRAVDFLPRAAETIQELLNMYKRPGRPPGRKPKYRLTAEGLAREAREQGRKPNWKQILEHPDVRPHVAARSAWMQKKIEAQFKASIQRALEREALAKRRQNTPL